MATKKVVKRKSNKNDTKNSNIQKLSLADLYALYMFVSSDANKGFGLTAPDARKVVLNKQKEIEQELYLRAYGFNPFEKYRSGMVLEGVKPEDIDLDRVAVFKDDVKEPEDKEPKKFIVAKDPDKEE